MEAGALGEAIADETSRSLEIVSWSVLSSVSLSPMFFSSASGDDSGDDGLDDILGRGSAAGDDGADPRDRPSSIATR